MSMKIKTDIDITTSSDMWYDLFDGGYIDPQVALEEFEDSERVLEAMNTVREFLQAYEDSGKLVFM